MSFETMSVMDDLLTIHQLQQILKVDRITIYRMLGNGRLRGFKVGGQWRFSRPEVESWIRERCLESDGQPSKEAGKRGEQGSRVLPLSCVQAVQSIFADAMEVATVTVDSDGHALTEISNGCDFCALVLSSREGEKRCSAFWKSLGKMETSACHAGLIGAGHRITANGRQVGTVAICQLRLQPEKDRDDAGRRLNLSRLASELGLPKSRLQAAAARGRTIRADQMPRLLHLLKQVAETFSKIGEERMALLGRLDRIAEITHFEP